MTHGNTPKVERRSDRSEAIHRKGAERTEQQFCKETRPIAAEARNITYRQGGLCAMDALSEKVSVVRVRRAFAGHPPECNSFNLGNCT